MLNQTVKVCNYTHKNHTNSHEVGTFLLIYSKKIKMLTSHTFTESYNFALNLFENPIILIDLK